MDDGFIVLTRNSLLFTKFTKYIYLTPPYFFNSILVYIFFLISNLREDTDGYVDSGGRERKILLTLILATKTINLCIK